MKKVDSQNKDLSVLIPLLNEEESLPELFSTIDHALSGYRYEAIFIDDGSTDGSWKQVLELKNAHPDKVKGVRLRRNYGKSTALQKGKEIADGTYVATMDADLQDDPHEIPKMIQQIEEKSLDLVSGWKQKRFDPLGKTIPSKFFNMVTSWVSGIPLHDFNCGLKVYRAEVLREIHLHGELHRYIPLLAKWEGFGRIGEHVVRHHPRKYGKSKFGLSRFIKGFLDLLTLVFLNSYVQRPMHFFGTIGSLFFLAGGVMFVYLVVQKVFYGAFLSDRPLLIVAVAMILLGAQSFSIGFLGELYRSDRFEDEKIGVKQVLK